MTPKLRLTKLETTERAALIAQIKTLETRLSERPVWPHWKAR